uniref:Plastid division protein CDP1-like 1st alpha solenoid domain-containing protein n=1 Tax=Tetraselmis sp. GSL018 TaxID=582737 RepID=A0A061SFN0_9CHLO
MPQTLNCSRGLHSCCRHSERVCRNASGLSPSVLPSLRGFGGYGLRSDINSKAVATCRLRHKSQLAAFGPLSSVFTAAAASDRSVIHVPVTWSQLLGVSVNDQDVNPEEVLAAFRELDGPEQAAFSAEAWASRREILLEARDRLLSSGTSKAADEISVGASRAKGLLLVLTELGFFEEVVRLEAEAAEGPMARALQDTDCRLALAMAHCGIAEELAGGSDKDSVSTGFLHMEAALEHLRGTGKASIAPSLAAIVQQSMEDMRPKFIVEQLKDPNSVVEREQLLGVVKDLLSREEPAKGIDSSFARGALGALTAEETIAVCSDWEPRRVPSLPWYFPRALERVAAAYAVKGFAQRSPALIAKAEQISALEESDTARACRAICQVLLGSKADAVGTLRQTSSWDSSMDDTEAMEELSNFTKQWLKHVGWKQFRKSEAMTNVPLSLVAYFTSPALLLLTLPFGRKLMRAAVAVQWMLDSLPFKRLPGREATEGALIRRTPAGKPRRVRSPGARRHRLRRGLCSRRSARVCWRWRRRQRRSQRSPRGGSRASGYPCRQASSFQGRAGLRSTADRRRVRWALRRPSESFGRGRERRRKHLGRSRLPSHWQRCSLAMSLGGGRAGCGMRSAALSQAAGTTRH